MGPEEIQDAGAGWHLATAIASDEVFGKGVGRGLVPSRVLADAERALAKAGVMRLACELVH
jgi:hypothetical protein